MTVPAQTQPTAVLAVCPCCGVPTKRLFAPGHDARYKGVLARAVVAAAGDFDAALVDYRTSVIQSAADLISVTEAIVRVDAVLHSDWRTKLDKSVGRLMSTKTPRPVREHRALPYPLADKTPRSPDEDTDDSERRRARAERRVDSLMETLNAHPKVGEWGWYRPAAVTEAERSVRYPARVQCTYRHEGVFGVDLLIIYTDTPLQTRELVLDVLPELWFRDPDAKV